MAHPKVRSGGPWWPRGLLLAALAATQAAGCKGGCQQARDAGTNVGPLGSQLGQGLRTAAGQIKEEAARFQNLVRLARAMNQYHDTHGHYPPAAHRAPDGTPLLSWRVLLLPHLGEEALYQEFRLDEPWDSPHNKALLPRMPPVYAPPGLPDAEPGHTHYKVFTGPGTVFEEGQTVTRDGVSDGLRSTLLVIEAGEPVPWSKPEDLVCDPDRPLPKLGYLGGVIIAVTCAMLPEVFMDDAGRKAAWEAVIRAMATRNGGETYTKPDSGGGDLFD